MHNTYYFFKHLVPELNDRLKGTLLTECFSQNKDELILEFRMNDGFSYFYIKAHLKSHFSCLSFPENFHRAKRNSVTLFKSLIGQEVKEIRLYENERSFNIFFKNDQTLLFKLHGNRSNILLTNQSQVIELFRSTLKKDTLIDIHNLDRVLDTSFNKLKSNEWDVRKTIPTLDRRSAELFLLRLTKSDNKEKTYNDFMGELNDPSFYVSYDDNNYNLTLLKPTGTYQSFNDPVKAVTYYFENQVKNQALSIVKTSVLSGLNNQLVKTGNYLIKAKQKLKELSQGASNQQIADVLMANLHSINKGAKKVTLHNFYSGEDILINLNPLLSAQKNAERFYRKAKNEAKEIAILKQNISDKEQQLAQYEKSITQVNETTEIKELKNWQGVARVKHSEPNVPYKEYLMDGFRILVGKNARQNDELTLKIAKKDDLWLHTKDVPGSHVIIKQIPGSNYPRHIIEKAAQLAAYYSKRRTESLCPVLYTQKKFVRKQKGAPAGAMIVEKEKVILVEPSPNP